MSPERDDDPLVAPREPDVSDPAPGARGAAGFEGPAEERNLPAERPLEPGPESEAREPDRSPEPEHTYAQGMLPTRTRQRSALERLLVRVISTFGIVAIGVAIGAIMTSSKTQGWIVGLVIAGVTVILSALLWSSAVL
ncbi:MAG: hypothetical protein JOZ07_06610 [Solirubrobacterales bacterium]|nr:hypothetical protein [Solirubrobacterales bacterium]